MHRETQIGSVRIEVHLDADGAARMARDVRMGLLMEPKELAPKYFYDELGSQLFEQITELPEYYPTRAERSILAHRSAEILAAAGGPSTLIELGSGSASKTRHILDAMRDAGCLGSYVPLDISEQITRDTANDLLAEYPGLEVHGVVCDFERDLERLGTVEGAFGSGPCMIAFLGGTIGNLYPDARREFLARIAAMMRPQDRLLLGTDLTKERWRLEAAYDDSRGVTAAFNKNVLTVLNREFDGDFDLAAFEHVARYDSREARIDIRLRSLCDQTIHLRALEMDVPFTAGEEMRTEISCKFTQHRLAQAYAGSGLELAGWFTDTNRDYALSLAAPVSSVG